MIRADDRFRERSVQCAESFRADWSLVYVGSEDGMEGGLVAKESDLPFRAIPAAAVRGRGPVRLARNIGVLARGVRVARRLIAELRPAAILGTGGYVCVPLFLAAWSARVPTAIYLPDVVPGLAVQVLARLATVVACSVEDSRLYLRRAGGRHGEGIFVTGYPTRGDLFHLDRGACRAVFGVDDGMPTLLVYGGSRGARSINMAIAALLEHLLPICHIIHVCGREGDEQVLRAAVERLPLDLQRRYRLYPYLFRDDAVVGRGVNRSQAQSTLIPVYQGVGTPSMAQAFGAADFVVCRSGASTLGEVPAAGLPALLVPYPYVHQDENADYLVRRGAALKVPDGQMLGSGRPEDGLLFRYLRRLIDHGEERAQMSERSRALAQPEAAHRLTDLLIALATNKRP